MLCETCQFTGRPGFVRSTRARDDGKEVMIPCPDCGGTGVAHCCDGLCEQPNIVAGSDHPRR